MSSELAEAVDDAGGAALEGFEVDEQLQAYLRAARAPNTLAAYRSDWGEFEAWCQHRQLVALPATPETLARYLVELAEVARVSTVGRRISSVAQRHRVAGLPVPSDDPRLRAVWAGIRRVHGVAPRRASPLTVDLLRRTIDAVPSGVAGTRDRALLLVGFAAALRRSEIVALDVDDVTQVAEGLVVNKRRSKTDQEGAGELLGVPYGSNPSTCPVRAVEAWCQQARIRDGALFRSVDRHGKIGAERLAAPAVNRLVQRAVARAGLPPGRYSAHSLRAGLATSAATAGVSERSIMNQTGHRSLTVARGYIRQGSLFIDNAAAQVGL
ncbi:MAG: site-specific integrase [Acidimicrobiales bacterium]